MEKFKKWLKDWGALASISLLVFINLFSSGGLVGGTITKPNTFSPGTLIRSSDINANFDTLYNEFNGNIDNANIDAAANIAATKIANTAIVSTPLSPQSITGTTTHFGSFFVSTTEGTFVVPRMTTAQRNALTGVLNGAIVYDSTAGTFYAREGGSWSGITPVGITATSSFSGKGVIEQATAAEAAATTIAGAGSTDAPLAITADITTSTRQVVGYYVPVSRSDGTLSNTFGGGASGLATLDANTLVVQNPASATTTASANGIPLATASGTIDGSWVSFGNLFGDGSDGNVTLTASTTLTRDMFYSNLTVTSGVVIDTDGFRIFVKNNLTFVGDGRLDNSGGNGGNASLTTGGTAGAAANTGGSLGASLLGRVGGAGGVNTQGSAGLSGTSTTKSVGTAAGTTGGTGSSNGPSSGVAGGSGGTISTSTFNSPRSIWGAYGLFDALPTFTIFSGQPGSGSGGGGGSNGGGSNSGAGGGSGAPGGMVWVAARVITTVNSNTYIRSVGGNGGNGGNGTVNGGGGGGGGGGNGGMVFLIYQTKTGTGTITLTGGTGGTRGSGGDNNGTSGGDGNTGITYEFDI